jgi:hypothetical protein
MFLLSDQSGSSDPVDQQFKSGVQSIYDRLPADGRLLVAIRGGYHFGFSDDGALSKSHIVMRILRMLGVVGIDGRRQLAITTYCVHSFFNAYLKGTDDARRKITTAAFPEIQVIN